MNRILIACLIILFNFSLTGAQGQSTCFSRLDEIKNGTSYAIVTEPLGDYYITGVISDSARLNGNLIFSGRTFGYFVAKFSAGHQLLWFRNVRDIGAGFALTLDGQGNVLLGGYYRNKLTFGNDSLTNLNGTWDNAFIAKFRPNGNHVWSKRIHSSHPSDGRITSLAADSLGNIYFGGLFNGTLVFGQDSIRSRGSTDDFWGRMDSTGQIGWVRAAGSPGTEWGANIAADKKGNVYITGMAEPTNAYFDQQVFTSWGYVARYSPAGQLKWLVTDSAGAFEGMSVVLGKNGVVAVTGRAGSGFRNNVITIGNITVTTTVPNSLACVLKLDTTGFVHWLRFPVGNTGHWGDDIVIKNNGNMVISCNVNPIIAEIDGQRGNLLSSCNLGYTARGYGIALQGQDALVTGEYTTSTVGPFDMKLFIAKFTSRPTGLTEKVTPEFSLNQSYPNPTSETAIIPYNLPLSSNQAQIIIRDMTGREVGNYELRKNSSSLEVNLGNLQNGIYTYTLVADGKPVATKKLVVMK